MITKNDQISDTNRKRIEVARMINPIDIEVYGTKVIVFPIHIEPKSVSGGIELLKSTAAAKEHYEDQPYQGIVVGINKEQSLISGIKKGSLVYGRGSANHHMMHGKVLYVSIP